MSSTKFRWYFFINRDQILKICESETLNSFILSWINWKFIITLTGASGDGKGKPLWILTLIIFKHDITSNHVHTNDMETMVCIIIQIIHGFVTDIATNILESFYHDGLLYEKNIVLGETHLKLPGYFASQSSVQTKICTTPIQIS